MLSSSLKATRSRDRTRLLVGFVTLAATALIAGCGNQPSGLAGGTARGSKSISPVKVSGQALPPSNSNGQSNVSTPPVPHLPKTLLTDAYYFYGLADTKPLTYTISVPGQADIVGAQVTRLDFVKGNEAVYKITRTGGMARVGTTMISLDPTGIYVISTKGDESKKRSLELPSDLKPGRKWNDHTKLDLNGQSMDLRSIVKVLGMRTIATAFGKVTALEVSASGSGTMNGKKATMQTESWYVKNIGAVKTVVTERSAGVPVQTITMQASK